MSITADLDDTRRSEQARPACAGSPLDPWFSTLTVDVVSCLDVCSTCPVRQACLDGAIARGEQYGIWGGRLFLPKYTLKELKRARLRQRRRTARRAAAITQCPLPADGWSAGLDGAA